MRRFDNKLYIKFTNKDEKISVEEVLVKSVGGDPDTKIPLAKKSS